MSDFSDRPFVAGSLVGLRAFDVDLLGRLTSPAYGGVFRPDENVAKCGGETSMGQAQARMSANLRQLGMARTLAYPPPTVTEINASAAAGYAAGGKVAKPEEPPHVVASKDCGCGYYAYFNGENTYAQPGRVSALIEGYGVCTVGEKGFRAEKARLVALIVPEPTSATHPRWDRWSDWSYRHTELGSFIEAGGGMAGLCVVLGGIAATAAWWLGAALILLGLALIGVAIADSCGWKHGLDRRYPNLHPHVACAQRPSRTLPVDLLRRNYPEVPVYATVRAALKAHPLTQPPPPEMPTPEDEDFWTREVAK